jgi:hypothetical protein
MDNNNIKDLAERLDTMEAFLKDVAQKLALLYKLSIDIERFGKTLDIRHQQLYGEVRARKISERDFQKSMRF